MQVIRYAHCCNSNWPRHGKAYIIGSNFQLLSIAQKLVFPSQEIKKKHVHVDTRLQEHSGTFIASSVKQQLYVYSMLSTQFVAFLR
jgi:hypothetical protein